MLLIAATHRNMNVRTQLKAESLEECKKLNGKWWTNFEVVGQE